MADQTTGVFATPLSTNPAEIRDQQTAEMRARMPGWRPVPGAPDTSMLAASAQIDAETRAALNDRIASEVRTLLGSIFGIPQSIGTPAFSTITVTAINTAGHTLDAGATLYIGDLELELVNDLVIAAGSSTGTEEVQAVEPGVAANGVTGAVELDTLDWLADGGVVLDAPLHDGTDPETDAQYDLRLRDEMQILSATPIAAADVAVYLRRNPAIGWAWAIKGYNSDTGLSGQARTVTAVVATADGGAVASSVRTAERDALLRRRETNWVVKVVSPSYVSVSVTATVVVKPGYDDNTVCAGVAAVLGQVLSPGGHMRPQGEASPANYQPAPTIHVNGLIAEGGQVDGLDHIATLQIGDGSSDHVTLSSPIQLPQPGTITVTVAP